MSAPDNSNPAQKLAGKLVNNSAALNLSMEDSISNLKFVPNSSDSLLLICGWDGMCHIYDAANNWPKYQTTRKDPILGCVATDCSTIYYGGLDNILYRATFSASNCKPTSGQHDDAIRCVEYTTERQIIVTGSWDSSVKLWDPKIEKSVDSLPQKEPVFCMAVKDELLVVATAERSLLIWDLRSTGRPLFFRSTSVPNYQSRCIDLFENKKRYVIGTIEGRISIENVDPDPKKQEPGKPNYAFKAHVDKENSHPVNAVRVMDNSHIVSGGSDGRVAVWNIDQKKNLTSLNYPSEIAAIDYSSSNDNLAIGCSYLHDREEDPSPLPPNIVYLRKSR